MRANAEENLCLITIYRGAAIRFQTSRTPMSQTNQPTNQSLHVIMIVIVGIERSTPESLVRLFLYTSVIKIRISSAALRNGQSSTPTGRLISRKRNTKGTTKK